MSEQLFQIVSYPRIHATLIGMNDGGYRVNGGVGFSVSRPEMKCAFYESDIFELCDERSREMNWQEKEKLVSRLETIYSRNGFSTKFRCVITGDVFPHCGFGSTSMLYLSAVEALYILNGEKYSPEEIIADTGRGRTSGIGIITYFAGGLVFDVGVSRKDGDTHLPSSCGNDGSIPLSIIKSPVPLWKIGICVPLKLHSLSEAEEVEFFKKVCPIENHEVNEILYCSLYGLAASMMESDFKTFTCAINDLQNTSWKRLEAGVYGEEMELIKDYLKHKGASAVGMSSLGPMLYFVADDVDEICASVHRDRSDLCCFCSQLNNQPRVILYGK